MLGLCGEVRAPSGSKVLPLSLILKAEVTIKTQIKRQKNCRVLSTMKEVRLGREQEKLGEVGFGDGSQGGFGESTYHRCENRTPGKQQGQRPAQAKAGSTQETKEAREAGAQRKDSDGVGDGGGHRVLRFLWEMTSNSHLNLVEYGMEPLKDWKGGSRDSLIYISKG